MDEGLSALMECESCGVVSATAYCDICEGGVFLCSACASTHAEAKGHAPAPLGDEEEVDVAEEEALAMLSLEEDPHLHCSRLFLPNPCFEGSEWLNSERLAKLQLSGFVVIDSFISAGQAAAIVETTEAFAARGELLHNSALSALGDTSRDTSARGDLHAFLHPNAPPCNQPKSPLTSLMNELCRLHGELAKVFQLRGHPDEEEYQLAMYPSDGSGYARHRDAMPDDGSTSSLQRRLTCLVYTSSGWSEADGGQLRLWLTPAQRGNSSESEVVIEPFAGRLLVFLAGAVDHAVMPSFFRRVAVTAWFH